MPVGQFDQKAFGYSLGEVRQILFLAAVLKGHDRKNGLYLSSGRGKGAVCFGGGFICRIFVCFFITPAVPGAVIMEYRHVAALGNADAYRICRIQNVEQLKLPS